MELPFNYPIRAVIWGQRHEIYDKDNKVILRFIPKTSDRHYLGLLKDQMEFMVEATNLRCKTLETTAEVVGTNGGKRKGGKNV